MAAKANFNAYHNYAIDSLHQWDRNQVLTLRGLNLATAPEVHFSNKNMDRAIVRQATMVNHVVTVNIPNSLLQDPLRIYAHIGIYEGSTFTVVETVEIPVIPRVRPCDYQIEDNDGEVYSFNAIENALTNAATKAEMSKLAARVDNIIANGNSTDGNSELMDARADINGKIHTSAGAAVRAQITYLDDALYHRSLAAFDEPGYLNLNGETVAHVNWFHTDYIEFARVVSAEVYSVKDLTAVVCYYDKDKNFLTSKRASSNASVFVDFSDKPEGAVFVRFCSQLIDVDVDTRVILRDSKVRDNTEKITELSASIYDLQAAVNRKNYISVFHDRFTTKRSDWVVIGDTDAWALDTTDGCWSPTKTGGYVNNTLTNVLGLNRVYEADKRICRVEARLYSDTVMGVHFYRTHETGMLPNEGMYIIDCANGILKMCALNGRYVQPDVFAAASELSVVSGNKYIIELEKDDATFHLRVFDHKTGAPAGSLSLYGWAAGTQIQHYGFSLRSGTPFKIYSVNISILHNPTVCFVGDSITEGHGMTDNLDARFAALAREAIGNSLISAGSSDTVADVIAKFDSEFKYIEPKVLFVTIGTNGTPTKENYATIKQLCDDYGIALILAHIPANNITGKSYVAVNRLIDDAGAATCLFDVATSVNYDPAQGVDIALTTDGTHVNAAGALRMFERLSIDTDLI